MKVAPAGHRLAELPCIEHRARTDVAPSTRCGIARMHSSGGGAERH
jgi:hypothetical protein